MASSSRPGAPTLQTGIATRPAPILRATSAPTGTPPLGSATTTGRTSCSPRATCSPSTLPASARSANRPSNKGSLAPGLLVRLVGVHHHPPVVVGVVADRDRPPDFHRARSSGVGNATRVVTSNGSPSLGWTLSVKRLRVTGTEGPLVHYRHDQCLCLGVEGPQVTEGLVLFRRRLRFANRLRRWRSSLTGPAFVAVTRRPARRLGGRGRRGTGVTGPCRPLAPWPACPLERPLSIDGQAQHSDHDHQHDGQR